MPTEISEKVPKRSSNATSWMGCLPGLITEHFIDLL